MLFQEKHQRTIYLKTIYVTKSLIYFQNEWSDIGTLTYPMFKKDIFSLYIYIYIYIGLGVRVFANGPGDLGSIPGRVMPKTQKMVLDASLLNTQHYKVRIKGKVEQSREGVAPFPTPWCSSYRKRSLRVTLDYGRQLYLYIYRVLRCLLYNGYRRRKWIRQPGFKSWTWLFVFHIALIHLEKVCIQIFSPTPQQ